jgi:hypothetical protein
MQIKQFKNGKTLVREHLNICTSGRANITAAEMLQAGEKDGWCTQRSYMMGLWGLETS